MISCSCTSVDVNDRLRTSHSAKRVGHSIAAKCLRAKVSGAPVAANAREVSTAWLWHHLRRACRTLMLITGPCNEMQANHGRIQDCRSPSLIMKKVTGKPARIWGPSIVHFGSPHYRNASGLESDAMLAGYSSRGRELNIHIMPGFEVSAISALPAKLGKLGASTEISSSHSPSVEFTAHLRVP